MAGNHLESLIAEVYQYRGYFVRRNVQVGKRAKGGYECELDIVAFHPQLRRLVHIEPSTDADSWEQREKRYRKKFDAGRKYIPALFPGMDVPAQPEQIAVFVYGDAARHRDLAGGRVMPLREFFAELLSDLLAKRFASSAVPEEYPLLRTLQFAAHFWPVSEARPKSARTAEEGER